MKAENKIWVKKEYTRKKGVWMKRLDSLDLTASPISGHTFVGDWINPGSHNVLPGTLFLYCNSEFENRYTVYVARENGKDNLEELFEGRNDADFLKKCAGELSKNQDDSSKVDSEINNKGGISKLEARVKELEDENQKLKDVIDSARMQVQAKKERELTDSLESMYELWLIASAMVLAQAEEIKELKKAPKSAHSSSKVVKKNGTVVKGPRKISKARRDLLDCLNNGLNRARDIADHLGKKMSAVNQLLLTLLKEQVIVRKERGVYCIAK